MREKIITLTTDFGNSLYPGVMKGVIASICPGAMVIDLNHHIPFADKLEAAYTIFCAYRYFPIGSVHLVVVDPEVGTEREVLMVEADRHLFVAPDNGVLTLVVEANNYKAFAFSEDIFVFSELSHTFHGRDIFAPLSAWIARGVPLITLGMPVEELVSIDYPKPRTKDGVIEGEVVLIDRFGNLLTNIPRKLLGLQKIVGIEIKGRVISKISRCYTEPPARDVGALFDSCGLLEIFTPQGDASQLLGVGRGEMVRMIIKQRC